MKNILTKIRKNSERGQAIILIAASLVGLVAIVGLMVDGGILLIEYARLKRGIDAASIAAASQFRKPNLIAGVPDPNMGVAMRKAGEEFLKLNQSDTIQVTIETCNYPGTVSNPSLCAPVGQPQRKMVRITASRYVVFGFMRIVGMNGTTISATSTGEAASIDLVLAIDTSSSMAFETTVGGDPDRSDFADPANPTLHPGDDPKVCNANQTNTAKRCEPLGTVKDVAVDFVDQLYFPYDRVAIVATTQQTSGGSRLPTLIPPDITFRDNQNDTSPFAANTEIQDSLQALRVFEPVDCGTAAATNSKGGCLKYTPTYTGQGCDPFATSGGNPTTCGASNIGGGLFLAGDQFAYARQDSFWAVIALIGGPANATNPSEETPTPTYPSGFCPGSLGNPTWVLGGGGGGHAGFCRDLNGTPANFNPPVVTDWTRSTPASVAQITAFSAYATAYDWSTYSPALITRHDRTTDLAHYDADDFARDGADYITSPSTGQGATLYSICMGSYCRAYPNIADPASAELLGRYMAESSGGADANHGLYYYSNNSAGLSAIFTSIAENIFTRISK